VRAFAIERSGSSPAIHELPDPTPGPGELLVRVAASSVNGFDAAVAAGYLQGMMEHRFPVVLGKDFAGTVEALGEGAAQFAVGDRVFGVVMKPYLGDGGLGELLAVNEAYGVARIPEELDVATAGALGLAGAAVVDSLAAVAPVPGRTVLISGATGGAGALAVQYAAAAGATVIATARPGQEDDFVRDLGAAHTVDWDGDVVAQVRVIAPQGVDGVLHFAGDPAALAGLLVDGGTLASTLGFGHEQHPAAVSIMADPNAQTLGRLAADVVAGRLRVPVTATYRLDEAAQAFADYGAGALGKLAVSVR
jgi:NADPH:quinone reductase-like Zn-dependent oxidoreductase